MNESFSRFRNSRMAQCGIHVWTSLVSPKNWQEMATSSFISIVGCCAAVYWLVHNRAWYYRGWAADSRLVLPNSLDKVTDDGFEFTVILVAFLGSLLFLLGLVLVASKSRLKLIAGCQLRYLWRIPRFVFAGIAVCFLSSWAGHLLWIGFAWICGRDAISQAGFLVLIYFVILWLSWLIYRWFRKYSPSRKRSTLFKPSVPQYLWALVTAIWWGYGVLYPIVIDQAYSGLEEAYLTSNVFVDTLATDAFAPRDQNGDFKLPADTIQNANNEILSSASEMNVSQADGNNEWKHKVDVQDLDLLFRYLKYLGMIDSNMSKDDFLMDEQLSKEFPVFLQQYTGTVGTGAANSGAISKKILKSTKSEGDDGFSTIKLIVALTKGLLNNPNFAFEKHLKGSLAGSPRFLSNTKKGESSDWSISSFTICRPVGVPEVRPTTEVINELFFVANSDFRKCSNRKLSDLEKIVEDKYLELSNSADGSKSGWGEAALNQAKNDYKQFQFFDSAANQSFGKRMIAELVARLHSDIKVKWARGYIALVQGLEQVCMLILALFMGLILALRFFQILAIKRSPTWALMSSKHSSEADVVASRVYAADKFALDSDQTSEKAPELFARIRRKNWDDRWVMRWIAQALPAIGFIGTVRGISNGLGSADVIVRAENMIAQAAAINQVTGQLGIAFTTTLIALVLGLLLSLAERLEASYETKLIADLENACSR